MAILSFKTEFQWGEPTYFVPKIWRGLIDNRKMYDDYMSYISTVLSSGNEKLMEAFIPIKDINTIVPKIHTIREDKHDFWQSGREIHPVVFNRTKNRFQFAPVLESKSVQRIEIEYQGLKQTGTVLPVIKIDGKYLEGIYHNKLARNDGFNSVEDFFRFFNNDFTGKIIHWTDFLY